MPAPPSWCRSSWVPCRKQRQRAASGPSASGSRGPGRAGSLPGAQTGGEAGSPSAVSAPPERGGAEVPREECGGCERVPRATGEAEATGLPQGCGGTGRTAFPPAAETSVCVGIGPWRPGLLWSEAAAGTGLSTWAAGLGGGEASAPLLAVRCPAGAPPVRRRRGAARAGARGLGGRCPGHT